MITYIAYQIFAVSEPESNPPAPDTGISADVLTFDNLTFSTSIDVAVIEIADTDVVFITRLL